MLSLSLYSFNFHRGHSLFLSLKHLSNTGKKKYKQTKQRRVCSLCFRARASQRLAMKARNLVVALLVIFAVCLIALVVQIVYVLWRRRIFWRRLIGTGNSSGDLEFIGDSFYQPPSKELLYFFCWNNQTTRIEPDASAAVAAAATAPSLPAPPVAAAGTDDELLKYFQGLYGPSRLLFTIKEEEKEEMETTNALSPVEKEVKDEKESVCSEQVLDVPMSTAAVAVDEATPFSTPCASPPFYTPSPSPPREGYGSYTSENDNGDVLRVERMQR
uniref:Uncharacterized protein n=1 Tax=Rhizophora mucronata TaxID=61149 RepID=A0A2P2PU33_RHIMU